MKKQMGITLAIVALGAMLIGGGTFALFTDTATNAGNTFTAGTLVLEDVTDGTAVSQTVYFDNLAPGDSEPFFVTVRNNGTLDAWVKIDKDKTNESMVGELFAGDYPLEIGFDDTAVLVKAGEEVNLNLTYLFPLEADNTYQGASGSFDLVVQAVQARNNTNDDETGPISWN